MENQETKIHPPTDVGKLRVQNWSPVQWDEPDIQAVLLCSSMSDPKAATYRKIENTYEGFLGVFKDSSIFLGYIGSPINSSSRGLARPFVSLDSDIAGVGETYNKTTDAFIHAFEEFEKWKIQYVAIFCIGNAAYCPEAVKRAMDYERPAGVLRRVSVFMMDEKYPDIASTSFALDEQGWPRDSVYARAYQSTERVRTFFLLFGSYSYNPSLLNASAPKHLAGTAVVTQPYSNDDIDKIKPLGKISYPANMQKIKKQIPTLDGFVSGDILIPFVGSDIWSREAVGFRMTDKQRQSCHVGTSKIIQTLLDISIKTKRLIWMPIHHSGASFIKKLPLNKLQVLERPGLFQPMATGVVVCGYEPLAHEDYVRLLGAAHLAISRKGGQSESSTILALLEKPNMAMAMPSEDYQQEELVSMTMLLEFSVDPDGLVNYAQKLQPPGWYAHWTMETEQLHSILWQALFLEKERIRRIGAAIRAFESMRTSQQEDIFSIARSITGLDKS